MRSVAKFRLTVLTLSMLAAPLFAHAQSALNSLKQSFAPKQPAVAGENLPLPSYPMPKDFNEGLDYRNKQIYLDNFVPTGLNAIGGANVRAARSYPGGDGSHARIVSFANARWMFNHPNLPVPFADIAIPLSEGMCKTNYQSDKPKDTSMIGILAGRDTGFGIAGVVPAAQVGSVEFDWGGNKAQVQRFLNALQPGDVVLFPEHGAGITAIGGQVMFPTGTCPGGEGMCRALNEGYEATNELIRKLVDEKQVHVVLDAGKGGVNLDHEAWLGRFGRDNDSGAIYVGAVDVKTGKRPQSGNTVNHGNYGSRIDLAGWYGQPGYNGNNYWYWTTDYAQTGSAAVGSVSNGYAPFYYDVALPQVAGVVALVQSVAFADEKIGRALPPKYLRQLLVETGHDLSKADPDKHIGKYPDAEAAVIRLLQDRDSGALQKAFEVGGWPSQPGSPEDGVAPSEPITGSVTIPAEVNAGESFTVSVDADSASNKPLTYAWKWMGSSVAPEGHKFTPLSKDGEPSMLVRAGAFDQNIDAYMRVIVSDGENERDFLQKVLIKSSGTPSRNL